MDQADSRYAEASVARHGVTRAWQPARRNVALLTVLALSLVGCDKIADLFHKDKVSQQTDDDDDKPTKKKKKKKKKKAKEDGKSYLGDSGFRPDTDGFAFANTGGHYPRTAPVLTNATMVKLFGADACVGGKTSKCKLTAPAAEWANMINRAMNAGQCEGMAVSSLSFFKKIDDPKDASPDASGAHELTHDAAVPLIGYYWAYQAVDPVMRETSKARRTYTPNSVEDKLIEMWKNDELATIAFWAPNGHGGHAVTPYAVEDKGNGVHWIRIYDNNYPDTERYITIDREANTWRYDLASLNPDVPKMPWTGGAASHNIVVIPLDLRMKKATCPFCRGTKSTKTVVPRSSAVSVVDQEGRRVGLDGDQIVNEIPDAEVVDLSAFVDGESPPDPIFILPAENDYELTVSGRAEDQNADDSAVSIFGDGQAITVEDLKVAKDDKDVISLPREGNAIRYKSATGRMPAFKMAVDDEKSGYVVRVGNLKSDANTEVELNLDRKGGHLTLQGGGKATSSYDIKMKHVHDDDADDDEVEQKDVKFKLGESHTIDVGHGERGKPGTAPTPVSIQRGGTVPNLTRAVTPKPHAKLPPASKDDPKKADPRPPVAPRPTPLPTPSPTPNTPRPPVGKPILRKP